MIGWRGRIGLIVSSVNAVMENEFHMMAPRGISIHTSRAMAEGYGRTSPVDQLLKQSEHLEEAATLLSHVSNLDVIVYGCTSGSFVEGQEFNETITRRVEEAVGIPTVTTSTSVAESLRKMGIKSLTLVSPYPEEINLREKRWLKEVGFEVTNTGRISSLTGFEIEMGKHQISKIHPELVYSLCKKTVNADADGIFITCTNLRAVEIIEILERNADKPVVTSNQASLYAALRRIGFKEDIEGWGKLLKMSE